MADGARPSLLDQDAPLERGRQLLTTLISLLTLLQKA